MTPVTDVKGLCVMTFETELCFSGVAAAVGEPALVVGPEIVTEDVVVTESPVSSNAVVSAPVTDVKGLCVIVVSSADSGAFAIGSGAVAAAAGGTVSVLCEGLVECVDVAGLVDDEPVSE